MALLSKPLVTTKSKLKAKVDVGRVKKEGPRCGHKWKQAGVEAVVLSFRKADWKVPLFDGQKQTLHTAKIKMLFGILFYSMVWTSFPHDIRILLLSIARHAQTSKKGYK